MSVQVAGCEKSAVLIRQTSQAQKILEQIGKSVRGRQDQQVVKICFPGGELKDLKVREMIHSYYNAEIVDYDKLFIKFDGGNKELIHRKISNACEAYNRNWFSASNVICMVGNNEWLPDVGAWDPWPSYAERSKPIRNFCIPPDLWIEVFYNRDPDRENALQKVDSVQQDLDGILDIELIGIALPDTTGPYRANTNPGAVLRLATATGQNTRPFFAPYLIHWRLNYTPEYYNMIWNRHIVLRCGFTIDFNIILDVISHV